MDSTLVYLVPWPASVTLLVLMVIAAVVIAVYSREPICEIRLGRTVVPARIIRVILITVRLFVFVLIVMMCYEWALSPFRTRRPDLAVIVDVTKSMSLPMSETDEVFTATEAGSHYAESVVGKSRLEFVKKWLLASDAGRLKHLVRNYDLRFFLTGSRIIPHTAQLDVLIKKIATLQANDVSSELGENLRSVLAAQRGRSTAAIVFLTDGVTTRGPTLGDVSAGVAAKEIPLYLVGLGSQQALRDVIVTDLLVDEIVFLNDLVYFDVNVTSSGFDRKSADVVLKKSGADQVLARTTVELSSANQSQRVQIPYTPTVSGDHDFIVEVVGLDGEVTIDNNQISVGINVRADPINVLLVQSYPNYEFRFLKNVLARASKSIQLTTILQEADYDYATTDEHAKRIFPVSREELFQQDVILFGDVNPSMLTASIHENLFDFVSEKGGAVVFMAGPSYLPTAYRDTRLADLLPLDTDRVVLPPRQELSELFQVRPTKLGLVAPQLQLGVDGSDSVRIWNQLPGLYWLLEADQWKPGVRVLVEHRSKVGQDGQPLPVITSHYVGSGKVLFHATDETWRWRYRVGDAFYARYWLQTIRYLGRSKLIGKDRNAEISSDRARYRPGDRPLIRVKFIDDRTAPARDDGVTVTLQQRKGIARRVDFKRVGDQRGIFESKLQPLGAGEYDVTLAQPLLPGGAPATSFTVTSPPGELVQPAMNRTDLENAAKVTRGQFYTEANIEKLLDDLPVGRNVRMETMPPQKLWNTWWIAGLFVATLTCEWLLRKKAGLF